jgi:hypothetical protein
MPDSQVVVESSSVMRREVLDVPAYNISQHRSYPRQPLSFPQKPQHRASNERPTNQVLLSFGSNPFPKACNHSFALLTYSPACSFSKTLGTTANPFSRSCLTCAGSCAPVARSLRTEEEEVGRVVVWVWVAIGIVGVLIVVGK